MVRDLTDKHANYFEAILQLRGATPEVLEFVEEEVAREHIHIAKKKEVTNGYDYYLTDNAFTKALGKKLQEKFGGQLLNTAKLYTMKKDKELYRGTVLFRLAAFKKGDVVQYQGEEYLIKIAGKEIFLQNQKTGEKARVKWKDMKKVKKIS